jgi:hypothetical protein
MVPLDIFEALMAVSATPLPDTEVNVPVVPVMTFPANDPFASRTTIVLAPLALAAVVLALATVPVVTFDPLIALIAEPLAVIMFAVNDPLASLETIVEAPFASEAVVLALAMVPDEMLEALIAVRATPCPDTLVKVPVVPVTTLAVNDPFASLATIVEAPLAEAAVVLALAIVPLDMLEALIAVRATPLPETEVKVPVVPVITFPAKEPLASRTTIVEAPLAEAAVVLALSKVPVVIAEALIAVRAEPLPEKDVPVIAPAANSPEAPRRTIVLAPLLEEAVVLAFAIVPDAMLDALIAVKATPLPETEVNVPVLAVKLPPESR